MDTKFISIILLVLLTSTSCKKENPEPEITTPVLGTFTDNRDGKIYKTIVVGTQTWMAENLAFLSDNNLNNGAWVYGYTGNTASGAKASANYAIYGVLYNWQTAQNVCPTGWHIPSLAEWAVLEQYISTKHGGYPSRSGTDGWTEGVGKHLKSKQGWLNGGNGTDDYLFTALPGGSRHYATGNFGMMGEDGNFMSTHVSGGNISYKCIHNNSNKLHTYTQPVEWFCGSIRCIKD